MTEQENSDRIDDLQVTADGNHDKIAELVEAAGTLAAITDNLNSQTGGQLVNLGVLGKRNRRMIWALAVSLALDIFLTLFVVNLTVKVDESQKLTRSQVLCPLYQQFVNADTPKARTFAIKTGQDLKARDEAFAVIHHSYNVLHCGDFNR